MISNHARYRQYQVAMAALGDENRIAPLPPEELLRRHAELWNSCFAEDEAAQGMDNGRNTGGKSHQ